MGRFFYTPPLLGNVVFPFDEIEPHDPLTSAVWKGLHVFLFGGPFLTILLTFSDRHHRQVWNTLQVLPLLLRSLFPA